MVSGLKGQRKFSLINAEEILRPKAKEAYSPENRTENLWAGSRIGARVVGGGGGESGREAGSPTPMFVRQSNTSPHRR